MKSDTLAPSLYAALLDGQPNGFPPMSNNAEAPTKTAVIFLGLRAKPGYGPKECVAVFAKLTGEQADDYTTNSILVEPDESQLLRYPSDLPNELSLCEPGAVFIVTLEEAAIRYKKKQGPVATPKWGHPIVREWSILHRATKSAMESAKRFERDGKRSAWKESLDPIQAAYRKLNAPQRAQLIADVVRHISG
jgi:hypothetical protein